jgi:hypothetical protein
MPEAACPLALVQFSSLDNNKYASTMFVAGETQTAIMLHNRISSRLVRMLRCLVTGYFRDRGMRLTWSMGQAKGITEFSEIPDDEQRD